MVWEKRKGVKLFLAEMSVDNSALDYHTKCYSLPLGTLMKNVSISLTDRHASEIDALIATGDYASVSEVIRAALREFMNAPLGPGMAQIEKDIAEYRAGLARGDRLYNLDELRDVLRRDAEAEVGSTATE
jgi:putative addiction module CopG family antidote